MKFLPIAAVGWCLTVSTLWAQNELNLKPNPGPTPSPSASSNNQNPGNLHPEQRWVEQIDGGFALPAFTSTVPLDSGIGGDINIGYRLDKTWALFIGSGYYQYNLPTTVIGSNALLAYIPLVAVVRMTFGDGLIRPYLFGGAGIALNTFTQNFAPGSAILKTSLSETDVYLAPGLGFLFRISTGMAVFLQSRVDLDYTSPTGLGLPLNSPSVFIPIQAGISFFAL